MPKKLKDRWWDELPQNGKQAARVIGYTKEMWDADEYSPYHEKSFSEVSADEKRAALFLGMAPLDEKFKDVYWEGADDAVKKHAKALGFTQQYWDEDWELKHLEIEHSYWDELTEEQQEAAAFFGYSKALWNETGTEEESFGTASASGPTEEEAPSDYDSDGEEEEAAAAEDPAAAQPASSSKPQKKKKKPRRKIITTQLYGGDGSSFDHPASKHIDEISVFAKGSTIHGIKVTYINQKPKQVGPSNGDEKKMKFRPGEFITRVKVSSSNHVHGLTFFTNKGTKLGPCGDDKGDAVEVSAPEGLVLCGLTGKTGKPLVGRSRINAIAFKWGPNPKKA